MLIFFLIIKFILGVESGASFPWSSKWQDKRSWYSEVPEALDALILGYIALYGWNIIFDINIYLSIFLFCLFSCISYAGIQSATWSFLKWYSHNNPNLARSFTTKPIVDRIASLFKWSLGDEGYAWIAAIVKGTIITLPMGGLGGIFFALGYELGSHANGRVDKWFNPHIISEGLSFVGVGLYSILFLIVCSFVG